jgi:hypothetical protein
MRWVTEYRRFAEECRRLAAALTKPTDRWALELMAKGWDKSADQREAKLRSGGDQGDTRYNNAGSNETVPAEVSLASGFDSVVGRISVCFFITDLDLAPARGRKPPISRAAADSDSLLEDMECVTESG